LHWGSKNQLDESAASLDTIGNLAMVAFQYMEERQFLPADLLFALKKLVWSGAKRMLKDSYTSQSVVSNLTYLELSQQYEYERPYLYKDLHSQKQTLQAHKRTTDQAEEEIVKLNDRIEELQKRFKKQAEDMKKTRHNNKNLSSKLDRSVEENEVLKVAVSELKREVMSFQLKKLEEVKKNMAENAGLNNFSGQKLAYENQIAEMEKEAEEKQEEMNKLRENMTSLGVLYNGAMAMVQKQNNAREELHSVIQKLKEQNSEYRSGRMDFLRPYTPRGDWRELYGQYQQLEIYPTLIHNAQHPSKQQCHELLKYAQRKEEEIRSLRHENSLATQMFLDLKQKHDAASAVDDSSSTSVGHTVLKYVQPRATNQYFVGLGNDVHVPSWLRTMGKVRNRMMSKRESELLIKEVWSKKVAFDSSQGVLRMHLCDYFSYFLLKFPNERQRLEVGYNLLDSLVRFKYDADCELFFKVVTGELPEETYYDQMNLLAHLRVLFAKLDMLKMENKKSVTEEKVAESLHTFFPVKSEESMAKILNAMKKMIEENPKLENDFSLLFAETANLDESEFIEEIRDQHLFEIEHFSIQIREEVAKLDTAGRGGLVLVSDIMQVLQKLDREASVETIEFYLGKGLSKEDFSPGDMDLLVQPTVYLNTMFSACLVKRQGNFNPSAVAALQPASLESQRKGADKFTKLQLKRQSAVSNRYGISEFDVTKLSITALPRGRGFNTKFKATEGNLSGDTDEEEDDDDCEAVDQASNSGTEMSTQNDNAAEPSLKEGEATHNSEMDEKVKTIETQNSEQGQVKESTKKGKKPGTASGSKPSTASGSKPATANGQKKKKAGASTKVKKSAK